MVPPKQAVANAIEFAANVLGNRAQDVQLEELESSQIDGVDVWLITLSMIRPNRLGISGFNTGSRDYKTFTVRKDTGEVIAMKIRELAGE